MLGRNQLIGVNGIALRAYEAIDTCWHSRSGTHKPRLRRSPIREDDLRAGIATERTLAPTELRQGTTPSSGQRFAAALPKYRLRLPRRCTRSIHVPMMPITGMFSF